MKKTCEWCRSKIPDVFHFGSDCPGSFKGEERQAAVARWEDTMDKRRAALKPLSAYPHLR